MDYIKVIGGYRLSGSIHISGAKNAALPLACLGLMTDQNLVLNNMPHISDVILMKKIGQVLGASIAVHNKQWTLSTQCITSHHAPHEYVSQLRASILLIGALLGREGKARFSVPGGCTIGARPIDYHLKGLQAMGVVIDVNQGDILATAPGGRVHGGRYTFPRPTVTGTLNLILAGVLGHSETVLHNIATEPEIIDTIHCLKKMGASIEQSGNSLWIQGQDQLNGTTHNVLADRIEMGTYMVATAITQGDVTLNGDCIKYLSEPIRLLKQMGIGIESNAPDSIRVFSHDRPESAEITTGPFPEFPTDLQSQFMTLMCLAKGTSTITETIWENRFMHVSELRRMGADITIQDKIARIVGQPFLQSSPLKATDLRASVGLILAGLAARGETAVHHIHHLDRGYEDLENKLSSCGAKIQRITNQDIWHEKTAKVS